MILELENLLRRNINLNFNYILGIYLIINRIGNLFRFIYKSKNCKFPIKSILKLNKEVYNWQDIDLNYKNMN